MNEIKPLHKLHQTNALTETINKVYYSKLRETGRSSIFYSIRDVYVPSYVHVDILDNCSEKQIGEYVDGFKSGYFEFENKIIKFPNLAISKIFSEFTWFPHGNSLIPNNNHYFIGELVGRWYYSWSFIIENQNDFEPLFIEYFHKEEKKVNLFKTNLNEKERIELCDRIISEKGGKQGAKEDNRIFIDITEAHRPTLMYLLGGKYPDKVEIMKVAVIGNLNALLKKITDVDGVGINSGTKVIPGFMKRFCIEFLRKRDGGIIKGIK